MYRSVLPPHALDVGVAVLQAPVEPVVGELRQAGEHDGIGVRIPGLAVDAVVEKRAVIVVGWRRGGVGGRAELGPALRGGCIDGSPGNGETGVAGVRGAGLLVDQCHLLRADCFDLFGGGGLAERRIAAGAHAEVVDVDEHLADEEGEQGEDDEQPQRLHVAHPAAPEIVQCNATGHPQVAQRAEDAPVQVPERFEDFLDGVADMLERVVRGLPAPMAVVALQGGVAVLAGAVCRRIGVGQGGVHAVDRAHRGKGPCVG